jgi:1-aminocyclopropane-1-carboxylate deaminase
MPEINPAVRVDSLNLFYDFRATVDVLRLDLLHPVISGNKWFKLKFYLDEARRQNKTLLTFGGAYSNHIAATAAAAKEVGLGSVGIIRGERATTPSHTLLFAEAQGMRLFFVSRNDYKNKNLPEEIVRLYGEDNILVVPEGGYGSHGKAGAKEILSTENTGHYTHILAAVGTGTTVAGLVAAAGKDQKVIGVSVLKNHINHRQEITALLSPEEYKPFDLLHDYHFGGYAKQQPALIRFMNEFYSTTGIPTDFIYTGKVFFAAFDLLKKNYFAAGDRLLLIHTGGLQGNLSLPNGTLIFG